MITDDEKARGVQERGGRKWVTFDMAKHCCPEFAMTGKCDGLLNHRGETNLFGYTSKEEMFAAFDRRARRKGGTR